MQQEEKKHTYPLEFIPMTTKRIETTYSEGLEQSKHKINHYHNTDRTIPIKLWLCAFLANATIGGGTKISIGIHSNGDRMIRNNTFGRFGAVEALNQQQQPYRLDNSKQLVVRFLLCACNKNRRTKICIGIHSNDDRMIRDIIYRRFGAVEA